MGNQIVSTETKFLAKEIILAKRAVEFRLNGRLALTVELDKLPAEVQLYSALFGLSQSVGDTASGFVKAKDERAAEQAMLDRFETLQTGWFKSEKGPRRAMPLADLIRLASKILGQDMTKDLTAMTVAEANVVAGNAKVQELYQAEKAAAAKAAAAAEPKNGLAELLAKLTKAGS